MSRLATLAGVLLFFAPAYLAGWAVAAVRDGWRAGRTDAHTTVGGAG